MNRLVPVRTMNIFSDGLLDHLFPVQIHDVIVLLQEHNKTQVQIL